MVGPCFWYTCFRLEPQPDGLWHLSMPFHDNGFGQRESTEGELRGRYCFSPAELSENLDVLIADAHHLGIRLSTAFPHPTLFVEASGNWDWEKVHPGWQEWVSAECKRRGWGDLYEHDRREEARSEALQAVSE